MVEKDFWLYSDITSELAIVPETNSNYTELPREIEVGHSIFNNL